MAPEASAGATLVWMSCECTSMPTAATQLSCAYDSLTEDLCWLVVTVRHRELDETGHDFAADEIASPCVHTHTSICTPTVSYTHLTLPTMFEV